MGNGPRSRKNGQRSKNKGFKKYFLSTKHRNKDVDQIQDELGAGGLSFERDEDLPGAGQFYCVETARHFMSADALAAHKKTKIYKKRLKVLKQPQYTQAEAEAASGMTKEILPPAHPTTTK
mmetsp:Transcript_10592/g.19550  ORF Transcript_10592/g.19550 Transcript_10592/m.19550 type:complete len:121 (-) Transcript_10592:154-516(-)